MDEQAIRQLEIETAKVLGWEEVDEGKWLHVHGIHFLPDAPRFARDAEAILSALEWLMLHSPVSLWDDRENPRTADNYQIVFGGKTVFGESLGITVCNAIIALQGSNP
jgi:hypothetical protein